MRKQLAAAGLTAGLAVGGVAGFAFTSGATAVGAQDGSTTTSTVPGTPAKGERPDRGQRLRETLQPLVDDETLTQAQADEVVETLLAARPAGERGDGHGPGGHGGPGGRHGGPKLDAAAEAIGITVDELRTKLRDGATIAEVAGEQGVEVAKVVDALVADATARIDERVTAGDITEEQADARKAELAERFTALVNGERPPGK